MPSTISSEDQKTTLNEGFRNAHKTFVDFLSKENIHLKDKNMHLNVMKGGSRKKSKTMSYVDTILRKRRILIKRFHLSVSEKQRSSSKTRRIVHSSKAK